MSNQLRYFMYCRKSSEDSHRQIASIHDQIDALTKIAEREDLTMMGVPFIEERSAKDPGRPIFKDMLKQIQKGKANALFCWDIDRLSRNPLDSGELQWMLQKGVIKLIKTPSRCFYPDDAGLLMSIEGGRATDYVLKLAKNVKRGMHGRAIKGWRPNLAPLGYLNFGYEKGNKTIIPDPERFEIIRKMWDLLLTGCYSITEISNVATNEWGLRTRKSRKTGGNPVAKNHLYNIFRDTFYYGYYQWKDLETGEHKMIKGNHKAMISENEYWHAQTILGKKGKPQPRTKEFAFTGLMKCGECNSSITAEEKLQIICSVCRNKFSNFNQTQCPKCETDVSEMSNPKVLRYTYYHCTKKKNRNCSQRSIKVENLEAEILQYLDEITIEKTIAEMLNNYVENNQDKNKEEIIIQNSLKSAIEDCQKRLDNLKRGFLSILNTNHELFTEKEFLEQKQIIITEKEIIERKIRNAGEVENSVNVLKSIINFCSTAKERFQNGCLKTKRLILNNLGSNLTIIDKKLLLDKDFPHLTIATTKNEIKDKFERLEPENNLELHEPNAYYNMTFPIWCATAEAIRTWIINNNTFAVPDISEEINTS